MALLLLIAALGPAASAQTAEPPSNPILRIETGMHAAAVSGISTDAANRYLVTASEDKTLRIWETATGRLLRIIRPPISRGSEGQLHAVSISPDGQTIATGGWTGVEWERSGCLYLFDRESGTLIKRLGGLPSATYHLAYSKDGRYLAATLGVGGIRIYHTTNYDLVTNDTDYGNIATSADFDSQGRLVTASSDGFIRLYELRDNRSLALIAKKRSPGGKEPFSASFSPDGTKIAVGFVESKGVDVLSGTDLSLLYSPDTSRMGIYDGHLANVAWAADGSKLYAGGGYHPAISSYPIRAWADGGRGAYRDIVAATNTIMRIIALRDGGVAYCAYDPALGVIEASGKRKLFIGPQIADFRDSPQNLLLSDDGNTVQFNYEQSTKSPAQFSITDRKLVVAPTNNISFNPPRTEATALNITDWLDTYTPKLNGKPLPLEKFEWSRCLAIAPDGQNFLLGTEARLLYFDKNGVERWSVDAQSVAWSVNITSSGELAVAAFGDGTIRWYRMNDGEELLVLFPHSDRQKWVMWTPTGYYDASPGAEELIGWHVNNGKDSAADFFPVKQVQSFFHRADVVAKILKTKSEAESIKLANQEAGRQNQRVEVAKVLPPVVEILSASDGVEAASGQVTVRYRTRTPTGEPVTAVKALVDGRPVAQTSAQERKVKGQSKDVMEMKISLGETANQISIIAENRYSASVPATVMVRRRTQRP